MELKRYTDGWDKNDPHANFKADVACYTVADPLPTLHNLSELTCVPVESLVRYVLVKYAASGADAFLAMGPVVFRQMQQHVATAEAAGTPEARLRAYDALKAMVEWLASDSSRAPSTV